MNSNTDAPTGVEKELDITHLYNRLLQLLDVRDRLVEQATENEYEIEKLSEHIVRTKVRGTEKWADKMK